MRINTGKCPKIDTDYLHVFVRLVKIEHKNFCLKNLSKFIDTVALFKREKSRHIKTARDCIR